MNERSFECYLCHIKIKSGLSYLVRHMRTHTIPCFFECPLTKCRKTFTRRYRLKTHFKDKHGDCEFPQKLKKVTRRRYIQPSVKTYQCTICNKLLRHGKANLRRHMENVHKKTIIKSKKESDKTWKGKGRARTRYVCICKKMFSTKSAIDEHVTSVHGGDRFICSICFGRADTFTMFSTKKALLLHCARVKHDVPDIVEPTHAVQFQIESDEST